MDNSDLDKLFGMSLEERRKLQKQAIEEIDDNYFNELDEQHKAESLAMMERNADFLNSIAKSLTEESEDNEIIDYLSTVEIVFLYYINKKKTDLSGIAGYWLYSPDYHIDISNTIKKFLKSGLIKRSDVEYDLNKTTISKLKEYAKSYNITVKGNKNQIITMILNGIERDKLKKEFGGRFFLRTEKGDKIILQNEEVIFFHCYIHKFGVSLSDLETYKNNHKEMSAKDIAIGTVLETYYKRDGANLERNCYYCLSEVYRYFNDWENQLICLLIVCYFDYDFSIDREDLEPFVFSFINSIADLIEKNSISKNDFNNYLEKCKEKINCKQNFLQFQECILKQLNKENKKIKVDDPIEFLGNYYKNGRRKDISPYHMNYVVNELIDDIESDFTENMEVNEKIKKAEQIIIYIMNDILNDSTMSKYELSLTCKRMGDYYYKFKMWSGAMNMYTVGLELNPKLAVKTKLKETKEKSKN